MLRITLVLIALLSALPLDAATQLGDSGHYLTMLPEAYVLNPDGRPFELTIHRFPWWIGHGWNRTDLAVKVADAAGSNVFERVVEVPDDLTLKVPAGKPGAWRIDIDARSGLNFWSLDCTLDRSVVRAAPRLQPQPNVSPIFCFNPFVPRTWYFWVPPGTERFRLRAVNMSGRSHREDHGLTVLSPRGQRMAVLWGQANPDAPKQAVAGGQFALQEAEILVEAGSAGRFWSLEVRMGDSHTYSDVNVVLEGVPPYLARSPEEWFNPETGAPADVPRYDASEFVQSDLTPGTKRLVEHWTPCPALGDPDSDELLCPARIALWNPENRPLKFVVGTYLPRNMFPEAEKDEKGRWKDLPEAGHEQAQVRLTGATGKALLDQRVPLLHLHGGERWQTNLVTGAGVARLDITGARNFWAYTYPATPAVLVGQDAGDGWGRFQFDLGTARNWYFRVPRGTTSFMVHVNTGAPAEIADVKINAPDRTVAAVYGHRGTCEVIVPPGLDDKVWHVRFEFGSATRFAGTAANPHFPSLAVTLDLKGVPPYLAPTWEQWFDPARPQ